MEAVEMRVLKSSFSGIKGAKKERKLLEESSQRFLGPGCREFESRHSDQISRNGFMLFLLISFGGARLEPSKCNADERCRRQLNGGEPLSAPFGADANESRHSDQKVQNPLLRTLDFFIYCVPINYSIIAIFTGVNHMI